MSRVSPLSIRGVAWLLIVAVFAAVSCSGDTVASSGDLASSSTAELTQESETDGTDENGANASTGGTELSDSPGDTPTSAPTPTPTPEGEDPLSVVTLMGESGVMGPLDGAAVAGVAAQIERINANGGILDRRVELTRIDTNSRVSLAERLSQRLLRNPPDVLIASCDVAFSEPVLDFANENGLLTISPCADDIGYSTGAWGPSNFTLGAPPEARGGLAAQASLARFGPTAMVLRDVTSPEARRFCNGFERAFRELGGTVTYRDEFTYDTLEPLLDRLAERGSPTSSIVLCSHVPGNGSATPNIVDQLRLGGFSAPIVSGSSVDEGSWFGDAPLLNELTYVSWSSIFGNDPDPEVVALIDQAAEDTDTPSPGATTVLGADAISAWAQAVEAVRTAEASAVSAALGSFVNEPFLTGNISFTAGARMDVSRTYRIMHVAGGEVEVPVLATVEG